MIIVEVKERRMKGGCNPKSRVPSVQPSLLDVIIDLNIRRLCFHHETIGRRRVLGTDQDQY